MLFARLNRILKERAPLGYNSLFSKPLGGLNSIPAHVLPQITILDKHTDLVGKSIHVPAPHQEAVFTIGDDL